MSATNPEPVQAIALSDGIGEAAVTFGDALAAALPEDTVRAIARVFETFARELHDAVDYADA